jgi:hypothetical protein
MLELQWHLFPLQFIALFFSFLGWRKTGLVLMVLTVILAAMCFNTHITQALDIVL